MLAIDDICPGDVLRHLSSGSRQYVLSLSGELYAGFNPKIDSEKAFDGYCGGLVRIALCDFSSWEVCDHSESGSHADAIEWGDGSSATTSRRLSTWRTRLGAGPTATTASRETRSG